MRRAIAASFIVAAAVQFLPSSAAYNATVLARRLRSTPLIDASNSPFIYNYNPTIWLTTGGSIAVLVRSVTLLNQSDPYSVAPSFLTLTRFTDAATFLEVEPLSQDSIVLQPTGAPEKCGVEDPRVALFPASGGSGALLYVTYTSWDCSDPTVSMATVFDSLVKEPRYWNRTGRLFPTSVRNSKAASILWRTPPAKPHLMLFGSGSILMASSDDTFNWNAGGALLTPRPSSFDSNLVEGGPAPIRLLDGNWLYVYNSDAVGPPNPRPGYLRTYSCGFAILNGTDPTMVLQRSAVPLLTAELDWELGLGEGSNRTQFPRQVYCSGLLRKPGVAVSNTFIMTYGAAGSFAGVAEVTVKY